VQISKLPMPPGTWLDVTPEEEKGASISAALSPASTCRSHCHFSHCVVGLPRSVAVVRRKLYLCDTLHEVTDERSMCEINAVTTCACICWCGFNATLQFVTGRVFCYQFYLGVARSSRVLRGIIVKVEVTNEMSYNVFTKHPRRYHGMIFRRTN
jgi:hypothetical protein